MLVVVLELLLQTLELNIDRAYSLLDLACARGACGLSLKQHRVIQIHGSDLHVLRSLSDTTTAHRQRSLPSLHPIIVYKHLSRVVINLGSHLGGRIVPEW